MFMPVMAWNMATNATTVLTAKATVRATRYSGFCVNMAPPVGSFRGGYRRGVCWEPHRARLDLVYGRYFTPILLRCSAITATLSRFSQQVLLLLFFNYLLDSEGTVPDRIGPVRTQSSDKGLHPADGPDQAGHDDQYRGCQADHDAGCEISVGVLAVEHDWIPLRLTTGASIGGPIAMKNSNSCYSQFGFFA